MKILTHGTVKTEIDETKKFTCENCKCSFIANKNEYYFTEGFLQSETKELNLVASCAYVKKYICSCPECHKIIVNEEPVSLSYNGGSTTSFVQLDSVKVSDDASTLT